MPNAYNYSSTAGTYTLTGSISNSATAVVLSSVTGLPSSTPFKVVIDPGQGTEEIVKVTAVAGMTLTVVRGHDGSTPAAHAAGATVRHMMTAEDLTLSRTHEAASAGVHGITGSVVGTSDAQSLTNKNLTGAGNTFPSSLATLTGAQVFTNKDLSSGTNVFPASLATLTGSQTLTNKTLTSPAIDTPTISSPSITGTTTAATGDVIVGDPASSSQRKIRLRKKSSTTADQGEVQLYVVDNSGENRAGLVLLSNGSEQARFELTSTGDFQVKVGGSNVFSTADSGWQAVTLSGGKAFHATNPCQVRKVGNRVFIRGGFEDNGVVANAETQVGTVPVGYRPTDLPVYINVQGSTGNQYSMAVINTVGAISIRASASVPDYFLFPGELNGWFA